MSDADETLDAMSTKLRELELDHVQLAGRIMQLREDMALYQNGPRRRPGRPRNVAMVNPTQANRMEPEESAA
jgi:hypothetical protein